MTEEYYSWFEHTNLSRDDRNIVVVSDRVMALRAEIKGLYYRERFTGDLGPNQRTAKMKELDAQYGELMSSDPASLYAMKCQLEVALDIVQRHMADKDSCLGFGPIDHILIQVLRAMEDGAEEEFRTAFKAKSAPGAKAPNLFKVVKAEPEAG